MKPSASRRARRREHCEGDSAISSDSSLFVNRPSFCRRLRIFRSKPSSASITHPIHKSCTDHAPCKRNMPKIASTMRLFCINMTDDRQEEFAMGPFPHDAPVSVITADNPAGTDGFEFVEFAHPEPQKLEELFTPIRYR